MVMPPASFGLCLLSQGGALLAIARANGLENLSHWKPHGQAFLMSANDIELARESAACAKQFGIPMVGLPGSAHEQAANEAGVAFIPGAQSVILPNPLPFLTKALTAPLSPAPTEWYIDLQYVRPFHPSLRRGRLMLTTRAPALAATGR